MRKEWLAAAMVMVIGIFLVHPGTARAGAVIRIGEDSRIDLGFRLQALYLNTDRDLDGDGHFEDFDDFRVRRARIRLGADVTQWASLFLQTEFAEEGGTGADARVIDAFVILKPHRLAHLYLGENMAPVLRQNLTSSGGLMAIDRPSIVYKNLTWGTRAVGAFATTTIPGTDAGLRGDVDVRDTGLTLFGSDDLSDLLHVKYYLGVYDGVQEAQEDSERYAGRVQVNLFDAESGYYNLSTYLAKKKTVGVGLAYDVQNDVATEFGTGVAVDYAMWTLDAFADYPVGPGSLTIEGAYIHLDLNNAGPLMDADGNFLNAPTEPTHTPARDAQGDGFYVQGGYLLRNMPAAWLDNLQPWAGYETWQSDGTGDAGSFDGYRFGLSYFIKGHNANVKAGYEVLNADQNFPGTSEDTVNTFVTGVYVTY